jgi:hypothetical protein
LTRKDYAPRHLELAKAVLSELTNLYKDKTHLQFEKWVEMCEAVCDSKYKEEGSEYASADTRVMVYNSELYGSNAPIPPDEDPSIHFETEE